MSKKIVKLTNKEVIDLYKQSKDSNIVNRLMMGIHELLNIQLLYFDQIEDILKKNGLHAKEHKHNLNACKNIFNNFECSLRRDVTKQEWKDNFSEHFDNLYDVLTKYFLTEEKGEFKNEEDKD